MASQSEEIVIDNNAGQHEYATLRLSKIGYILSEHTESYHRLRKSGASYWTESRLVTDSSVS